MFNSSNINNSLHRIVSNLPTSWNVSPHVAPVKQRQLVSLIHALTRMVTVIYPAVEAMAAFAALITIGSTNSERQHVQ